MFCLSGKLVLLNWRLRKLAPLLSKLALGFAVILPIQICLGIELHFCTFAELVLWPHVKLACHLYPPRVWLQPTSWRRGGLCACVDHKILQVGDHSPLLGKVGGWFGGGDKGQFVFGRRWCASHFPPSSQQPGVVKKSTQLSHSGLVDVETPPFQRNQDSTGLVCGACFDAIPMAPLGGMGHNGAIPQVLR